MVGTRDTFSGLEYVPSQSNVIGYPQTKVLKYFLVIFSVTQKHIEHDIHYDILFPEVSYIVSIFKLIIQISNKHSVFHEMNKEKA